MSFSYTRPKPTDTSLLAPSVSLSPSSVTGHPGKLSFTHTFSPPTAPGLPLLIPALSWNHLYHHDLKKP